MAATRTYASLGSADKEAINCLIYGKLADAGLVAQDTPWRAEPRDQAAKMTLDAITAGRSRTTNPAYSEMVEKEIEVNRELYAANPALLMKAWEEWEGVLKQAKLQGIPIESLSFTVDTDKLIALDGDQFSLAKPAKKPAAKKIAAIYDALPAQDRSIIATQLSYHASDHDAVNSPLFAKVSKDNPRVAARVA